jgi:diguanylate cyclase (GGDEF)-like protein
MGVKRKTQVADPTTAMSQPVEAVEQKAEPIDHRRDPGPVVEQTGATPRQVLLSATVDAGGDSYTALRAVWEGEHIADWVVVDANALVRQRWADTVGEVIGQHLSRLNAVAPNHEFERHFQGALLSGTRQEFVEELALPGGEGGWRRTVVVPVSADTIVVTTRDISREVHLERALQQERQARRVQTQGAAGSGRLRSVSESEVRFLAWTASALFAGAGLIAIVNSSVTKLADVNLTALRLTGLVAVLMAIGVRALPWNRHSRLIADSLITGAIAFLVVSDHFDHYGRDLASSAVYPVFFIIIVAWSGLVQRRGFSVFIAALAGGALLAIFSSNGHTETGWQCVIVTMPAAAVLGEVLCWSYSRATGLARLEANRRLHDPLTDLANRQLLVEQLDHALSRIRRTDALLAVLYVDLDRFKQVNDSFGHDAGDELLLQAARTLRNAVRENDVVARLGGDEFAVLCEDLTDQTGAVEVAVRILEAFDQPLTCAKRELYVTSSIGVAFSTHGAESPDALLRDADAAMYRAKRSGRNRIEVFDETMRHLIAHRLELTSALHHAVEQGELRVHYQPIYARDAKTVRGYEALVRWERPGFGLLKPGEFMDVAEDSGAILAVGEWMLGEVCRQASHLAKQWPDRRLGIAVNVASRQLVEGNLVELVERILKRTGLDPELLTLELTETTLIDDAEGAQATLNSLHDLGVKIALDDFGTGYSSLTYLQAFPIDIIKIDGSFVRTLGRERQGAAIISAIISLAQSLGITVVAEGIETEAQLDAVACLGCDLLQGFYLSVPKPIEDLEPPLATSVTRSR